LILIGIAISHLPVIPAILSTPSHSQIRQPKDAVKYFERTAEKIKGMIEVKVS